MVINQRIRHRPSGRVGTIAILYPDRHRARLRLDATSDLPVAEMDEVAWHDLEAVTPEPTAQPAPAPAPPAPVVLDETREDASDPEPPRRGRRPPFWPERADGE